MLDQAVSARVEVVLLGFEFLSNIVCLHLQELEQLRHACFQLLYCLWSLLLSLKEHLSEHGSHALWRGRLSHLFRSPVALHLDLLLDLLELETYS